MIKNLFMLIFGVCLYFSIIYSQEYNPCDDITYIDLKKKTIDKMTDREYDYFIKADKDCKHFLRYYKKTIYRGPRIGFTLIEGDLYDKIDEPLISQFGWQEEMRMIGGENGTVGLIEFIGLIGGIENGYFLPSLSTIIGLRTSSGFEFGLGPNFSITGIEYAVAFGFSIQTGGLVFPQNFSLVKSDNSYRISYITGFNAFSGRKW